MLEGDPAAVAAVDVFDGRDALLQPRRVGRTEDGLGRRHVCAVFCQRVADEERFALWGPVRVGSAFSLCGEGAATRGLGFGARRGTVIRSGSATIPPSSAWRDTGYVMLRAAGVRSPLCWTALGQSLSGR